MKRILAIGFAAACMLSALAGCGEKTDNVVSSAGSAMSGAASNMGEAAEDIGEGVTAAVTAVVDEASRMAENGQVSDGDGIIGNEGEEEEVTSDPVYYAEDTTADADVL